VIRYHWLTFRFMTVVVLLLGAWNVLFGLLVLPKLMPVQRASIRIHHPTIRLFLLWLPFAIYGCVFLYQNRKRADLYRMRVVAFGIVFAGLVSWISLAILGYFGS
jgi:hypothetical protein